MSVPALHRPPPIVNAILVLLSQCEGGLTSEHICTAFSRSRTDFLPYLEAIGHEGLISLVARRNWQLLGRMEYRWFLTDQGLNYLKGLDK